MLSCNSFLSLASPLLLFQTTRAEERVLSTSGRSSHTSRGSRREENSQKRINSRKPTADSEPAPPRRPGPAQPLNHLASPPGTPPRPHEATAEASQTMAKYTRHSRTICEYPTGPTIRDLASSDTQQLIRMSRLHHFQPEGGWPQHPTTHPRSRSCTVRISSFNLGEVASKPTTGLPFQFLTGPRLPI